MLRQIHGWFSSLFNKRENICNVLIAFQHTQARLKEDLSITKTYLYNIDPLKPHFYIVKLGFTGVYTIFLISAQKHRLWVLVRTASRIPNIYVLSRNMQNIRVFLSENFQFLEVKFSIYLNRRVIITLKGKGADTFLLKQTPIQKRGTTTLPELSSF